MVDRSISRRRYVSGAVAGVVATAGCLGNSGGGDASSGSGTTTDSADEGTAVTITATVVDASGAPVSTGEVIALGDPEGLEAVAPDADGEISIDLTAGSEYTLQYTQGQDGYPDDDLPDLFTIGRRTFDGDTDLGRLGLPRAYDVDVRVETADGEDVTDDAAVSVSHANDGTSSGFDFPGGPVELVGDVTVEAEYDGASATAEVSVTEARTVTLTVGSDGGSGDGDLATVSGALVDPSRSPVTTGEVVALGDPEGRVAAAPNDDGRFSMELTDGNAYRFQYTQTADGYPDDDLPGLYTIAEREVDGDIGLAEQRLPQAYDVTVRVETADGEDVTDDATVSVAHTNFGTTTDLELSADTIELMGDVTVTAEYEGTTASTEASVGDARTVVVTVEA